MIKKKTKTTLLCTCDLPGCGKSWESQSEEIPKVCRWCFSRRWNGTDKRKQVILTAKGKTQSLAEWSRETGLNRATIRARLKAGRTQEESLGFTKHQVQKERKP